MSAADAAPRLSSAACVGGSNPFGDAARIFLYVKYYVKTRDRAAGQMELDFRGIVEDYKGKMRVGGAPRLTPSSFR